MGPETPVANKQIVGDGICVFGLNRGHVDPTQLLSKVSERVIDVSKSGSPSVSTCNGYGFYQIKPLPQATRFSVESLAE